VDGEGDAFGRARRRVAVAVGAQRGHAPLGDERHGRRVQPRPGGGGVPGAQLGEAPGVAGPDQEDVAVTDGHPMGPLGGFELLAEHVLAGLQPGHTPQPGDVEQHAPADEAVLEGLDAMDRGAPRGDLDGRVAVVQAALEGDVAQRVDVAVGVAVVVEGQ
jgi:hypothetical protein